MKIYRDVWVQIIIHTYGFLFLLVYAGGWFSVRAFLRFLHDGVGWGGVGWGGVGWGGVG